MIKIMEDSVYTLMKQLYVAVGGDESKQFDSKYSIAIGLLDLVEDYEIFNNIGKEPKIIDMNLYPNGTDPYYTFSADITNGDYIEGNIKINGLIPGGKFKAFVIQGATELEIAMILIGNTYSGQSVSLIKSGTKFINKI